MNVKLTGSTLNRFLDVNILITTALTSWVMSERKEMHMLFLDPEEGTLSSAGSL